jgi:thioredoxin reductase (NADPH)
MNKIEMYDAICIGAGPTGLASAIEIKRAGMRPLVIDKGCLCNSLYHYPVNMVFFTTPELLEIGDIPMTCATEKPTRVDALKYYRKTAEHFQLELRLYEAVTKLEGHDEHLIVHTEKENGEKCAYHSRKIVVATGYYDLPNRLNVHGEDLAHVSHYYTEPHAYWEQDVVVIGGKNSAAEAALELYRSGARVTLVHRGAEIGHTIKYWVRPDIENRIRAGQIRGMFETHVTKFEPDCVWIENKEGRRKLPARQAFVLTGYHPDFEFLRRLGISLDSQTNKPEFDSETHESNVPGIYLAGVIIGGNKTSEIFIENGRLHGKQIAAALAAEARTSR